MNPLGTRKNIWGSDFSEFSSGFICYALYLILIIVSNSLTMVVGRIVHINTGNCISMMLQCDCAMQLWAMLSVAIWLCGCVMQLDLNTHISNLLTKESQWLEHPYQVCGGSWVQIPCGVRISSGVEVFFEFPVGSFVTHCTSTICFLLSLGTKVGVPRFCGEKCYIF